MQPTIVLVHGAFAESSGWDPVIDQLLDAGHPVIAAPNPLRSLASDATAHLILEAAASRVAA